ncbi:bifunctional nuclease family protein [Mariniluteicoccus endophyticus]
MGVRVEMPSNIPMVLLREVGGQRYLPIWIGANEAAAIANAQEDLVPPRPLTHDLMLNIILDLGHVLDEVRITRLNEGTFYAELVIDGRTVSARPSDAIALAVRAGADILCADEVLDTAGIEVPDDEGDPADPDEASEDVVEEFREFLDHVNPDDFFTGDDPQDPPDRG